MVIIVVFYIFPETSATLFKCRMEMSDFIAFNKRCLNKSVLVRRDRVTACMYVNGCVGGCMSFPFPVFNGLL